MRAAFAVLLMLSVALAGCSKGKHDADGDSLSDGLEKRGWPVRVDYLRERVEYRAFGDPGSSDGDGDGLPDNEEYLLGLDPSVADTDKDGLTDCQEERHTNRSECEAPPPGLDADGGYGTDPKKADSDPVGGRFVRQPGWFTDKTGTLPGGAPDSGDGIADGDEVQGYAVTVSGGAMRTVKTNPRDSDFDNDGLGDGEEREYHGDPTVPDTDGDGCDDGGDPFPDRIELLRPRPLAFTLATSEAVSEIQVELLVAGSVLKVPKAGTIHVQPGQTVSFGVDGNGTVHPSSCSFPAFQPVVEVVPSVIDLRDPVNYRFLDVTSGTPGDKLLWDLRAGTFSWQGGAVQSAPILYQGADGTLAVEPQMA